MSRIYCILSLLSFLIFSIFSLKASAYNCMKMPLSSQTISSFSLIFDGEVLETNISAGMKIMSLFGGDQKQGVTFKINRIWHGDHESEEILLFEPYQGGGGCPMGYGFKENKSYLVYANKLDSGLYTASAFGCTCSYSSLLESESAKSEIEFLTNYKKENQ